MSSETVADLPKIESRMMSWMTVLALLALGAILAGGRRPIAMAFAVGAGLGMLNFHWLWLTGKALMEA